MSVMKQSAVPTALALSSSKFAPLIDIALCLFLSAPIVGRTFGNGRASLAADVAAASFALVLLLLRHRWPIPALAVGLVSVLIATARLERVTVLLPIAIVLIFTVAVTHQRRTAVQAGLVVLLTVIACIAMLGIRGFFGPGLLAGLAWPALAVAAGNAVRTRREAIVAAEQRAALAEATREDEARRRVVEERLHIARELHDVIAHKIAVITVQAGVAAHLLRSRPDDAAAALATVRSSASEVLDELAGLLGVLRTVDEQGASTEPTPTLDDIPTLIASFERVGLHVKFQTSGRTGRITQVAEIAAYRTIQEALTNAHKHGDGHAMLRMKHEPEALNIVIANRITIRPTSNTIGSRGEFTGPTGSVVISRGYGLLGMTERVQAAGGTVTTSTKSDNTFVVSACLPYLKAEPTT
jgi:signal transduction histidine kinase